MKDNGKMAKEMVKERKSIQVEMSTTVIGKKIKCMDMELTLGLMEIFTQENGLITKDVEESIHMQMEIFTMADWIMVSIMGKVL